MLKAGRVQRFAFVDIGEDSPNTVAQDYELYKKSLLKPSEFIIEEIFEEVNHKELVENILVQIASLDESISEAQFNIEALKLDTRDLLSELEKI